MIEVFQDIINDVPTGSVIAGGAVRDYVLGIPHRDIDVFIPHDHNNRFNGPWEFIREIRPGDAENYDFNLLADCREYRRNGHLINLIWLTEGRTIQQHLDGFDFGINQIAWSNGIQMSPNFVRDWKDRTITIVNDGVNVPVRADRFQRRFRTELGHDYPIVGPIANGVDIADLF